MPEKGWYSLTVRFSTTKMIRELARTRGLTVDELLNKQTSIQNKEWLVCSLCGVKVKTTNMSNHMAKMHPR
jgi:transcription initiation factor IIE alpha subunit